VLELDDSVRVELEGAAVEEPELTRAPCDGVAASQAGFGIRVACGVRGTLNARARRTTAVFARRLVSSMRAMCSALETPPVKMAANPLCDRLRAAECARGLELLDANAMTTATAIATLAVTAATIRESALAWRMPRIALRGLRGTASTRDGSEASSVPVSPEELLFGSAFAGAWNAS
jgi:hypothetical protein